MAFDLITLTDGCRCKLSCKIRRAEVTYRIEKEKHAGYAQFREVNFPDTPSTKLLIRLKSPWVEPQM